MLLDANLPIQYFGYFFLARKFKRRKEETKKIGLFDLAINKIEEFKIYSLEVNY